MLDNDSIGYSSNFHGTSILGYIAASMNDENIVTSTDEEANYPSIMLFFISSVAVIKYRKKTHLRPKT